MNDLEKEERVLNIKFLDCMPCMVCSFCYTYSLPIILELLVYATICCRLAAGEWCCMGPLML